MITSLITFLCILIALAIFAGAFYLAQYVVKMQHRINVLEDSYKEATDYIAEQDKHIITLQQEIDFIRRTEEERAQRNEPRRTWNPGDLMNMGERR